MLTPRWFKINKIKQLKFAPLYKGYGQKRAKRRRFENLLKGEFFSTVTMVTMHDRGKQSPSGSRYVQARKHRLLQMGSKPTHTKLGENQRTASKRKFGIIKVRQTSGNTINLSDPQTKKTFSATIKLVTGNPANRHFVRRNIITKGTILDTDKGKARVTSRPGQHGVINAVLVE